MRRAQRDVSTRIGASSIVILWSRFGRDVSFLYRHRGARRLQQRHAHARLAIDDYLDGEFSRLGLLVVVSHAG